MSESSPSPELEKLEKWLNLKLPGAMLFLLSFFYNVAFYLFLFVALVFTPFLLKSLYHEKRYGWILSFILFVILPSIFFLFIFAEAPVLNTEIFTAGHLLAGKQMITSSIFIGLYVFYCHLLKISIPAMLYD